jgi:hypothetical protein
VSTLVLLSFGPRVHFRSQKSTFMSNHPDYNFQSKTVKLSYYTLEKSFFFIFNQFFFPFISKLPNVARSHQRKTKKNGRLLGTCHLGVFQKKLGTKLFIFTVTKKFHSNLVYLVLALESISGVKRGLFGQTPLHINFSQKLSNYHISLWKTPKYHVPNKRLFFLFFFGDSS